MFQSFFRSRQWWLWAWLGGALIFVVTWYKVQLDVQINDWYGTFWDYIQRILSKPGSSTMSEFYSQLWPFAVIAGTYVVVASILEFFIKHWVFRWRTAMTDYYTSHWPKVRHIEGASQRVQDDTYRFARIMETLGVSFMQSIMTLVAFLPILWVLSAKVTELPFFGKVDQALVWVAIMTSILGTVLLAAVGTKLPGLQFANQKTEAAYRKELVLGEDSDVRANPPSLNQLWQGVRTNHFRLFFHYAYFDVARIVYLQANVVVPYIALAPSLLAGVITLGVLNQITNVFGQVQGSFQFLVNSWTVIVELISVYKRLRGFEQAIRNAPEMPEGSEQAVMNVTV
jgi:peptide/bleomycin uptake transporter